MGFVTIYTHKRFSNIAYAVLIHGVHTPGKISSERKLIHAKEIDLMV